MSILQKTHQYISNQLRDIWCKCNAGQTGRALATTLLSIIVIYPASPVFANCLDKEQQPISEAECKTGNIWQPWRDPDETGAYRCYWDDLQTGQKCVSDGYFKNGYAGPKPDNCVIQSYNPNICINTPTKKSDQQ